MEGKLSVRSAKPAAVCSSSNSKGGDLFARFPNYPEYRSCHRNQMGEIKRSVQHLKPSVQMRY